MSVLGSTERPLRVAIVGSGPSGFYATEALFKSGKTVLVDMYERLPVPYGLVRNGVAPDHPKLKQVMLVYDKIARTPGYRFAGNVNIGHDLNVAELREAYHAIIFTCGAESDRRLGVPGENLPGSYTATEFVGWYNGHPDYRDRSFDLSQEIAVIIGQGNVAADVCRILAKTVDELKNTDIAEHALDALAQSRVREIHVIGRRGPAQAKFTNKELRELGELADADAMIDPEDLKLNPESETELADKNNIVSAKNVEIFQSFTARSTSSKHRRCHFHFFKGPVELRGRERLETIVLEKNRLEGPPFNQVARGTSEKMELPCGLLFRSIGYKGVPITGVPFDERKAVFSNEEGRLRDGNGVIPGLYCAGWIKRGPTGIIGTNRADSVATVNSLITDLTQLDDGREKSGVAALYLLFASRGVKPISFENWLKIDAAEVKRGEPRGKPREKFTRVSEMLGILD
jgi:ferredoxin--NADP+ reductase